MSTRKYSFISSLSFALRCQESMPLAYHVIRMTNFSLSKSIYYYRMILLPVFFSLSLSFTFLWFFGVLLIAVVVDGAHFSPCKYNGSIIFIFILPSPIVKMVCARSRFVSNKMQKLFIPTKKRKVPTIYSMCETVCSMLKSHFFFLCRARFVITMKCEISISLNDLTEKFTWNITIWRNIHALEICLE